MSVPEVAPGNCCARSVAIALSGVNEFGVTAGAVVEVLVAGDTADGATAGKRSPAFAFWIVEFAVLPELCDWPAALPGVGVGAGTPLLKYHSAIAMATKATPDTMIQDRFLSPRRRV